MLTQTLISIEEYFEMLEKSDTKLEYHDGEVVAMAGGGFANSQIKSNFIVEIGLCDRKKKECLVLDSDLLLKIDECKKFVFPDAVMVCQEPKIGSRRGIDYLENPEIIVEEMSESTEETDRFEKFECYKTLSSFKQYILASSKKKRIEVYTRTPENRWELDVYHERNPKVKIGVSEMNIESFYEKVNLPITSKK